MRMIRATRRMFAYDSEDIKRQLDVIAAKKKEFYDAQKDITDQIDALQAQMDKLSEVQKGFEEKLKSNFKEFDKQTGVRKMMLEAEKSVTAAQALKIDVSELVEYMDAIEKDMLRASKSEKPSYKTAWETLVSLLNGTEFERYVEALQRSFLKNITEFKDTYGVFKVTASKDFDDEFKKLYNERKDEWDERHPGKPMPAIKELLASRNAHVRIAGIMSWFGDFGAWIAKTFMGLADKVTRSIKSMLGLQVDIDRTDKIVNQIIAMAQKASR